MDSELCPLSQSGERDDHISCLCNYNYCANIVNFNFNLSMKESSLFALFCLYL
jgi:hypothetical protein